LAKLDSGIYDAIILASAGLKRLVWLIVLPNLWIQASACRQLARGHRHECRVEDPEINEILNALHDAETGLCVTAERAMNARLNGGCQVPIAGFAQLQGEQIFMRGLVGSPDGVSFIGGTIGRIR